MPDYKPSPRYENFLCAYMTVTENFAILRNVYLIYKNQSVDAV